MDKRTPEQPYSWELDAEATRPLTDYTPKQGVQASDTPTAPTQVITPTRASQEDATEVLAPASSSPSDPTQPLPAPAQDSWQAAGDQDATQVLPPLPRKLFSRRPRPQAPASPAPEEATLPLAQAPLTRSSTAGQPTRYTWPAQTPGTRPAARPAPAAPYAPERPTPSRGLQVLNPANIRQTRPTTWAIIQHLMALFTLVFLLLGTFVFFVQTPTGQEFDETAYQEFAYQFFNYQYQTHQLLDLIPAVSGLLALIGLVFILVWKHRFLPAVVGVLVALGANGSAQLLKNYLITKPNYGIQEALMNSAPSGHTTFAAAAGAALFLASPKKLRPTIALLASIFTLAAGFSTIVNGWHRPSDVISAIFLTGAWTVIGLMVLRFMRSEELDMSNTQRSGMILIPLATITSFFMGFCALVLYVVNIYQPLVGSSLTAASCLILAASTFTMSMLVSLLRPQNKQRKVYTKVWTY